MVTFVQRQKYPPPEVKYQVNRLSEAAGRDHLNRPVFRGGAAWTVRKVLDLDPYRNE